jgi:hypothetical protein
MDLEIETYFKPHFNWKSYIFSNSDLKHRTRTFNMAWNHWNICGHLENRTGAFDDIDMCVQFTRCKQCDLEKYARQYQLQFKDVVKHYIQYNFNESISTLDTTSHVLIALPTYNRSHLIEGVIRNIVNQTVTNWTLVIIDDGSSMKNKEVFRHIQQNCHYKNIQFIDKLSNTGISNTLNIAIDLLHASSKYTHFTWISDDNVYYPNFIECLLTGNTFFKHTAYDVSSNGEIVLNYIQYQTVHDIHHHFRGCAAFMWTQDAVRKIGRYDEDPMSPPGTEDKEYLIRTFSNLGDNVVTYLSTPTMCYLERPKVLREGGL